MKASNPKSIPQTYVVGAMGVIVLIMAIVIIILAIQLQGSDTPQPFASTNVRPPFANDFYQVHITTTGDIAPFTVREAWITSYITLIDNAGVVQFEDAQSRIRGRGNSSWHNSYMVEKRPLRIRFDGSSDDRLRQMAGSDHAARNWVLRSNHMDKSLMRDYTGIFIGRLLPGMYWQTYTAFVHLYVNGEYMGVYLLADERNAEPGRAQLTGSTNPAESEFMIEMDWRNYRRNAVEGVDFFRINTYPGGPRQGTDTPIVPSSVGAGMMTRDHLFNIRYPDSDVLTSAHFDYLVDYFTAAGTALREGNFAEIERLLCIDSLIDHYFIHELFHNVDAGMASTFFQLKGQGDERRLVSGPVWDLDIAAGNAYWLSNQTPYGLYVSRRWYWARAIHQTPELYEIMLHRWSTYFVPAVHETLDHIYNMARTYQEAFELNFERFPIMGVYVWPNPPAKVEVDTFLGQVEYLSDFLLRRLNYLDSLFNS